jgi:hypothetical protein
MTAHPSPFFESLVAFFIPSACREEVLGDLYERYLSPPRYAFDAFCTVPFVIASRIRRTSDVRVLLSQILALYLAYLLAARFTAARLLVEPYGLLRLAAPVIPAIAGMALDDAYANPWRPSSLGPVRAPVTGILLALISQIAFRLEGWDIAVPGWTLANGSVLALLFATGVRMLFPPVTQQHLQGIDIPPSWLKQAGPPVPPAMLRAVKGVVPIVALLLVAFIAYRLWERAVP